MRSATGNAVSSMLNAIKATSKQAEKDNVTGINIENQRSNSASRGRGWSCSKPN